MRFHVHLEKAEEGGFVVTCPALPGCASQGETVDESLSNIREAIEGWLVVNDIPSPQRPGVEVREIAV